MIMIIVIIIITIYNKYIIIILYICMLYHYSSIYIKMMNGVEFCIFLKSKYERTICIFCLIHEFFNILIHKKNIIFNQSLAIPDPIIKERLGIL